MSYDFVLKYLECQWDRQGILPVQQAALLYRFAFVPELDMYFTPRHV